MEPTTETDNLNHDITLKVFQIHLGSWRYFTALTLLPVAAIVFSDHHPFIQLIIPFIAFWVYYFCWRLWLDEQLFRLFKDNPSSMAFDNAMQQFWGKRYQPARSFKQRCKGARRLLYRAGTCTAILWVVWIGGYGLTVLF